MESVAGYNYTAGFRHGDIDDTVVNGSLPIATENLIKLLYQRISGL